LKNFEKFSQNVEMRPVFVFVLDFKIVWGAGILICASCNRQIVRSSVRPGWHDSCIVPGWHDLCIVPGWHDSCIVTSADRRP